MLRLLLFLAVSIHAAGANAQTVEEEVALIVNGFEAGRVTGSPCGLVHTPQVISTSPAKYRFDCGNGDWTEAVFRQIDGCKFDTSFTMNGEGPDRAMCWTFQSSVACCQYVGTPQRWATSSMPAPIFAQPLGWGGSACARRNCLVACLQILPAITGKGATVGEIQGPRFTFLLRAACRISRRVLWSWALGLLAV